MKLRRDGSSTMDYRYFQALIFLAYCPISSIGTPFYYGMYKSYGTGDTVITTTHANGGTMAANRKWQVECFDGEVAVAIGDNIWDFQALTYIWCKFLFPFKPPSQGLYPYYPRCNVRDYRTQFFCYDKMNHSLTVNTFVTGFWSSNFIWWTDNIVLGVPPIPVTLPYKCCRTPRGYYIDYVSCYYVPTHDLYWEYYGGNYFLVQCATGYVMAGVGSTISPINLQRQMDYIQCCRLGWGAVTAVSPPIINVPGRPPAYTTSNLSPSAIPQGYAHQYRRKRSIANYAAEKGNSTLVLGEDALTQEELYQFEDTRQAGLFQGSITEHDVPPIPPSMTGPLTV